jgi:signal transduction histidine kinase
MRLVSLKARILFGATLWTIGHFMIVAVIFLNLGAESNFVMRVRHAAARSAAPTAVIAGLCMYVGFLQVRRGISSIDRLRNRLAAVHKGIDARVGGFYPAEVQPVVDELNALLDERERRVARAVAKAGDLAHGLKTPLAVLAVLAHDAQQVGAAAREQLAAEINQQVDRMRRQIDYHLARARSVASSASPGARASIAASAEGIARVLQRLHSERGMRIEIDAPASNAFSGEREDLDEMLGNLLDNACKWARTRVKVTCSKEGEQIVIVVDDDGPGIEPSMREAIMQRGVRADEAAPGSGLGLAIVRDIAEIYRGSISLAASPMGGARAQLSLPGARTLSEGEEDTSPKVVLM